MKKINNEKGSLALFVTIAMLFFMMFLLVLYISTTNEQKTQLSITTRIKETYEEKLSNESLENIYEGFVGKDAYIPIYTVEQLKKVGSGESVYISEVKAYYTFNLDSNYILKNDIDLNKGKYTVSDSGEITFSSDAEQWTPIGTSSASFTGIFDGNSYKISGLYINNTDLSDQGLFGYSSGTIQNLTVDNGYINANTKLGGFVGQNLQNGLIDNCVNKNEIVSNGYTGGICGINDGTIQNCLNFANILNNLKYDVGGIVGKTTNNNAIIKNCNNSGNIMGISVAGGIIGTVQYGALIEDCFNNGIISATDSERSGAGGIVGYTYDSGTISINNCYNLSKVSGDYGVGGIIGINSNADTTINNCYNKGNVVSERTIKNGDNQYHSSVGGICGGITAKINIVGCYNEGKIEGNGIGVGGIIGGTSGVSGLAEKCYNIGNIVGTYQQVGGIIGSQWGEFIVNLCNNNGTIEANSCVGGIVGTLGWTSAGYIKNSYNIGVVKANTSGTKYVGGIAGIINNGKVENCYNIGSIYVVDQVSGSGVIGNKGTSSTVASYSKDTVNCYYLTGTATGGINGADVTGQAEVKTAAEMKTSDFVTLLNNGENNWKLVSEENNGYPILNYQN